MRKCGTCLTEVSDDAATTCPAAGCGQALPPVASAIAAPASLAAPVPPVAPLAPLPSVVVAASIPGPATSTSALGDPFAAAAGHSPAAPQAAAAPAITGQTATVASFTFFGRMIERLRFVGPMVLLAALSLGFAYGKIWWYGGVTLGYALVTMFLFAIFANKDSAPALWLALLQVVLMVGGVIGLQIGLGVMVAIMGLAALVFIFLSTKPEERRWRAYPAAAVVVVALTGGYLTVTRVFMAPASTTILAVCSYDGKVITCEPVPTDMPKVGVEWTDGKHVVLKLIGTDKTVRAEATEPRELTYGRPGDLGKVAFARK